MEAPRCLAVDDAGFCGVWRDVHFETWTAVGEPARIRARFELKRAFMEGLSPGRKMLTVSIVHDAAAKPMDAETRALVQQGVGLQHEDVRVDGRGAALADGAARR